MSRILVTGANRGIGLELCRQFSERGDEVIAVCRQSSAELQQLAVQTIDGIDVSEAQDVARLQQALAGVKLDVLVNNAGILRRDKLSELDFDDIEQQFRVNAMAPLRVSSALLGNLSAGSKIFVISSSVGSIEENTSGSNYGYRMSKVAVNMAMKSLSVDLAERQIGVFMLHPGYVATDMTEHQGPVSTAESVKGLQARIGDLKLADSGSFWHAQGRSIPW
ncbi:MAG: SDR family oxidoreductase [Xanthomonadales bacterium]|nr:SDR family oxidoreductase [Xanthomonadales bacterium]